jgi:hypothetical protein
VFQASAHAPVHVALYSEIGHLPEKKKAYDQRGRIAETLFGLIKVIVGLRQFLLRALEKVQTEWQS